MQSEIWELQGTIGFSRGVIRLIWRAQPARLKAAQVEVSFIPCGNGGVGCKEIETRVEQSGFWEE
jgi:hypothetical protein